MAKKKKIERNPFVLAEAQGLISLKNRVVKPKKGKGSFKRVKRKWGKEDY